MTGERETHFCHYNPALLGGVDDQVPLYSWMLQGLVPPIPLTSYNLEKITSHLMESLLSMILNFFRCARHETVLPTNTHRHQARMR